MCNFHSAGLPPQCLVKLQFRDRLCIDTRIVQQLIIPGFYRSVHLGRRRVHSYVHCVAAGLRFCSPNLHLFLHHLAGSSHRQRILMIGDCMVQLPHKLGIVGAGCDMEECRPILRSRPHAAPSQGKLQRLAARWQCVDAIANQLKLITQYNFHQHRISRRLYSGARPLHRPKQNAIIEINRHQGTGYIQEYKLRMDTTMKLPHDYATRVYAGVLGKIIGVYLGRPIEGWSNERIERELGEVNYYINERMPNKPLLIVTDDDISGTFTFLRALPDYGNSKHITPQQIGQSWLNYIIERKTILWWGGLGNSTEHTAFIRLKQGIPAPRSGSIALNGKVVAEQIGSQIFIDGWAMVAPGDPVLAADLARRAASVSHDAEGIYGAVVMAAMESLAFVEPDLNKLIDTGLSFIPKDSVIARMIHDIREWHDESSNWRESRNLLDQHYGYDNYGGNCHMVPNHGVIMLSLLYGKNDFQKSLMIANTAGWDTDCNSGNVGCLLGIKNGLEAINAGPDWRGPVADRMYLSTADGGRAITDAVAETYHVVNIGRALAGQSVINPKQGARFHFELPGSVQGFIPELGPLNADVQLSNDLGHSLHGQRSLCINYDHLASGQSARVATATFIPTEAINMVGYSLLASPTLYSSQTVRVRLETCPNNQMPVQVRLYLRAYDGADQLVRMYGSETTLAAHQSHEFTWRIPDTGGQPIAEIGLEINSDTRATGRVFLDSLTWDGIPSITFNRPADGGQMWRRMWVDGTDHFDRSWREAYRIVANYGTSLLMTGTREWTDYTVSSLLTPHLCSRFGLAARAQGLQRFYALLLCSDGKARLIKALDGEIVLAEIPFEWHLGETYSFELTVTGSQIRGSINEYLVVDVSDQQDVLTGGCIALVCSEGRMGTDSVRVDNCKA